MQSDLFDHRQNKALGTPDYQNFREQLIIAGCTKCPLHKGRTNLVIDRGNPDTKILVIGEAPGKNEDLEGKAFVGRAGQLLDKIMSSIGLDTNQDMLIINTVKCRPPDNRPPTAEEVKTCRPYLNRQLELVNPQVIVLLGATALKHILPQKKHVSMEEVVGQFFTDFHYPKIQFMVLYHPAYLLYDPRKKAPMLMHVKKLKEYLDDRKES